LRLHAAAGGPASAPIFFSIDEDIDADTWKSIAVQWLRGINSVIGVERVGVYGSAGVCGWAIDDGVSFYFLCLVLTILATLGVLNLLRSPTGRAFVAIRDSEISAQSMGIHLARYKTLSFAISAESELAGHTVVERLPGAGV